jgi:hypothetical protein
MKKTSDSTLRQQAIEELRSLIADLDGRIERQRLRVQRAQVTGGPHKKDSPEAEALDEMRSLLEMMIGNRSMAHDKLSILEAE